MKLSTLTFALLAMVSVTSTATLVQAADPDWTTARQVFKNDKGQFRSDWAAGINRPVYIDGRLAAPQNRNQPAIAKAALVQDVQKAPDANPGESKETPVSPKTVRHFNDKGRLLP